jgi:hypothetical protein
MPYVRTKQVGAYKVVTGFEPPSLDPVESKKIIGPMLIDTDEYKGGASVFPNQRSGQNTRTTSELLRPNSGF